MNHWSEQIILDGFKQIWQFDDMVSYKTEIMEMSSAEEAMGLSWLILDEEWLFFLIVVNLPIRQIGLEILNWKFYSILINKVYEPD